MIRFLVVFMLFSTTTSAQEVESDSLRSAAFAQDFEAMVEELAMCDSIETKFRVIYNEFGTMMKEAYENRTSWMALGHTYEWASRDRDTKLKAILSREQLYLFKKRQKELEQKAKERNRMVDK